MNAFIKWFRGLFEISSWTSDPKFDPNQLFIGLSIAAWSFLLLVAIYSVLLPHLSFAVGLPGDDASDNLKAAGTLLKLLDTGIFKWGAKIFAGLCIMSSAWALKEQRFGIAIICVIGAIIFGTAPKWVSDIFSIGGNTGIFSQVERLPGKPEVGDHA